MAPFTSTRRRFLRSTAAGLAAIGLGGRARAADPLEGEMPTRPLGKTGENVSILCLGGHHIGRIRDESECIALIRHAVDLGVTFMDNAWEYHGGRSEELMGKALAGGYRDKAFLMTKHHGRKRWQTAMEHLEDSLRRLKTDHIDLWQYHEVVYPDDPDWIFRPEGAILAAEKAKKQGKVRFIGFTGHKDPNIHMEMLAHDYPWDTVQMPLNPLDAHFKSFEKRILPILEERGIGVVAMKTMAGGHALRTGTVKPAECLRYVWSLPVDTIVSGIINREHLHDNVRAAKTFKPMSEAETKALLARTKEPAMTGDFEPFKTTRGYDGPVGRRQHGVT
jgi:predicted aldo/keto reductase-like oxidoreductase